MRALTARELISMSLPTSKSLFKENWFSEFKSIELKDKEIFDRYFHEFPPEISELTFTNLFCWQGVHNFKFCKLQGQLLIGSFKEDKVCFFYPIGKSGKRLLMKEIFQESRLPVEFFRLPERLRELLKFDGDFKIEEERDNFDYVYLSSELISLKGSKFDAKRNFIKRFRDNFAYAYYDITPDLIKRCLEFEGVWCSDKDCENIPGLKKERCAILNMLNNFSFLKIKGGAIEVRRRIVAITLGEKLNGETLVIHAEKASSDYPGAYQVINQEFCKREARDFKYVNREQDLGLPGLRKAKLSYQPFLLLKKFTVSLRK